MTSLEEASPLMKRLQNLVKSQEEHCNKADLYLANVKCGTPNGTTKMSPKNEIFCSPELRLSSKISLPAADVSELIHYSESRPILKELPSNQISTNYYPQSLAISSTKENIQQGMFQVLEGNVNNNKKFPFLKKGQGKNKDKRLIGFKKKSELKQPLPNRELKLKSVLKKTKLVGEKSLINDSESGSSSKSSENQETNSVGIRSFEALEQLVERDSFVSDSSTVRDLLNGIDHSLCSTPVLNQRKETKNQFNIPDSSSESCPTNNYNRLNGSNNINLSPIMNALEEIVAYDQLAPTVRQPGILKRISNFSTSDDDSSRCTTPRVQFQPKGARILEYDQEIVSRPPSDSMTSFSEDSDLISVSDLEHLALLQYNVQVVHELTTSSEEGPFFERRLARNMNLNNQQHRLKSPEVVANKISKIQGTNTSSYSNYKSGTVLQDQPNDIDLKVPKLLLLAKVEDLKKEINSFKDKNETLENLIKELNEEKSKIIKSQEKNSVKFSAPKKVFYPAHQTGKVWSTRDVDSRTTNDVKLQKLNAKLIRIANENSMLKNKVSMLQNKVQTMESEVKKDESDHNKLGANRKLSKNLKQSNLQPKPKTLHSTAFPNSKLHLATANIMSLNKELPNEKHKSAEITPECQRTVQTCEGDQPHGEDDDIDCIERVYKQPRVNLYDAFSSEVVNSKAKPIDAVDNISNTPNCGNNIEYPDSKCLDADESGIEHKKYSDRVVIVYKKDQITRTIYNDGKETIDFPNGQKETYFKDGSHYIVSPDRSSTAIYCDGTKKSITPDGTKIVVCKDGTKDIQFPNGQREVHLPDQVKRIYPNGTVKVLYNNGSMETKYNDGRVRIKHKDGTVVMR